MSSVTPTSQNSSNATYHREEEKGPTSLLSLATLASMVADTTAIPRIVDELNEWAHSPIILSPKDRLYTITNETNREDTFNILSNQEAFRLHPHTSFIGISGLENMNFISAIEAKWAVLFDKSGKTIQMLDAFKESICQAKNRIHFLNLFTEKMKGIQTRDAEHFEVMKANLSQRPFETYFSWFYNRNAYGYIKTLYEQKRIVHLQLNFTDKEALERIQSISSRLAGPRVVYISNLRDWVVTRERLQSEQDFEQHLSLLCNDQTLVISAKRAHIRDEAAPQTVQKIKSLSPLKLLSIYPSSGDVSLEEDALG